MTVYDLTTIDLDEISFVDRPANPGAVTLLHKRLEDTVLTEKTTPVVTPDPALARVAELEKSIAALTAENTELKKAADVPIPVMTPEDILKAEPVKAIIGELSTRLEKAETAAKRYEEQFETQAYTQKAAPLVAVLPITAESLGGLLRRTEKGLTTAEDATELERLVKAMAEIAKTGNITQELGKSGGVERSAHEKTQARAAELRKSNPALTVEQAYVQALDSADYADSLAGH
jgi:hypothetical protein